MKLVSLEDVAFAVCTAMADIGVTAVLSGGGAASFYAPQANRTRDLDFVMRFATGKITKTPLEAVGFRETASRGVFSHPDVPWTVELLPGPLAVGDEQVTTWQILRRGEGLLHILSPTDCVRDRLAAAIHWNDRDSIRQAVEVACLQEVDLVAIEAWCNSEGGSLVFKDFKADLLTRKC